ncbi:hypothetical protein Tco_0742695 [Tanacetum coccineum]
MGFSMSATLTSSQKILTSFLKHFDVGTRNCDAVSTSCMPSHDHLRVKLQSCPISSQVESKSCVFPPNAFQITFNHHIIELENQVQRLMEAHIAPKASVQVNNIASSCEIHDTQTCMENPKQAFVDYASSRTDKARGKWFTFKPVDPNRIDLA